MHLEEKTINSETLYEGKVFTVKKDTVILENGAEAIREVVHHSGGVCVVPLTDKGEVIMVKQFRYPFATQLLEVPAGKINYGEDHAECGRRELLEETGAVCDEYIYLGSLYPTTAYDTEKIHMYLAMGLHFEHQNLDEDEFLDVLYIPFEKAIEMVMNDEIHDSKTQIALLKTKLLLEREK